MDYKKTIEAKYNREAWQELLHDIFGQKATLTAKPSLVSISNPRAKQVFSLGKISLSDGETIAVYEVELSDNVIIERNRRGIRDLLTSEWRNAGFAGAFVFSFHKDDNVLRFSYVSETWGFNSNKEYVKFSTDTLRYTYLLGEGQGCHTAIERFTTLKNSKQTLSDVTDAFSVEALSNEFFYKYLAFYAKFVKYLTDVPTSQESGKYAVTESAFKNALKDLDDIKTDSDDDAKLQTTRNSFREKYPDQEDFEKAIRDYVKKMLGRIVFLHFLQRKGWMYSDGMTDEKFMVNLLEKASDEHKKDFLDTVLEPLFFAVLNTKPEDRIAEVQKHNNKKYTDKNFKAEWDEELVKKWNKTPYLNGGLFEEEVTDMCRCIFPYEYFHALLDFFSQYNFTINENDPSDALIGVDPEMLSRIFENLLEDNKEKGAYYTPKTIVRYMCQQSLIAYLQTDIADSAQKDAIARFVESYEVENLGGKTSPLAAQVDQKLRDVKICDPAIGSGAFPMGLLRELFMCRGAIEHFDNATEIKKQIIQNNIYGVDIERGAVDIARLRFWLSLVVDEEEPQPLPNLDYKIMQGNSLLESFHGIDLSQIANAGEVIEGMQVRMVFNDESTERELFRKALNDFFNCSSHEQKEMLRRNINEHLQGLLKTQCSEKLQEEIDALGLQNNQFFLWHTWFQDVFSRPSNPGFDIVIGNPPYVQLQDNGGRFGKLYKNCDFKTFDGNGDIYCLFYERGQQLLNDNGHLCFITSNKWMRAGYGDKTREFLAKNTNPKLLIDFAGVKIFENVTVDPNILLFAKSANQHNTLCAVTNKQSKESINNLSVFVQQQGVTCDFPGSESWVILSPIEQSIKRKIEAVGTPLKDWDISIYRGVLTGYNDAFIISTEKRDEILANCQSEEERTRTAELIRPILRGRDIKKYGYEWANLWLIYLPWHFPLQFDETIAGASQKAEQAFCEQYPSVYRHMLEYKEPLSKRNKAETGIRYEWYALQRWGAKYWDDFFKPKVMWKIIGCNINFSFDDGTMICNNAVNIMTGQREQLLQFLGLMNSKLFDWYLKLTTEAEVQGGGIQLYVTTLEKTMVKLDFQTRLGEVINQRVNGKVTDDDVDDIVFESYKLTHEEIEYILTCKQVNR